MLCSGRSTDNLIVSLVSNDNRQWSNGRPASIIIESPQHADGFGEERMMLNGWTRLCSRPWMQDPRMFDWAVCVSLSMKKDDDGDS